MHKGRQPLISLCMITKNEEAELPSCLASVKEIVDEIIVIDTGSTDKTIDIAKKEGAIVQNFKWQNDFASARNVGLEIATGKWILILDADESLSKEDANRIKSLLHTPMVEGYLFYIVTHLKNVETNRTQSLRLFRNRKEYRFQNRVFERIPEEKITSISDAQILVHHHPDSLRNRKMQQLKLELVRNEIEQSPTDPYLHYAYGIEYLNQNKLVEAMKQFQIAIKYVNPYFVFTPHLFKLFTWTLMKLEQTQYAIEVANQGIHYFPFYTDLFYFRGQSYLKQKSYQEALQDFEHCLKLGDSPSGMIAEDGLGSFKTLLAIGETHEALNNLEKAFDYYKSAYRNDPTFDESLYRIGTFLQKNPSFGEIDSNLLRIIDRNDIEQMMTLIDILCLEHEYSKAMLYIEEIEKKAEKKDAIHFVKAICLMMLGNHNQAESIFSAIPKNSPFYSQVLLKRIQNFWFHQRYEQAKDLIMKLNEKDTENELSESTKELYLVINSLLSSEDINEKKVLTLNPSQKQMIAKLIEYFTWLKHYSSANKLLQLVKY